MTVLAHVMDDYDDVPELELSYEMPECPMCDTQDAEHLGALGKMEYWRCRGCGITYRIEPVMEGGL